MMVTGMQEIFDKMREGLDAGKDMVLAVILEASGSTPRGKGAAMLSGRRGLLAGSIGGGALEGAALRRVRQCLEEKRSEKLQFLLDSGALRTPEEIATGMICGGEVSLWLQYIDASREGSHRLAKDALSVMKDGGKAFLRFDLQTQEISVAMREVSEGPDVFFIPFGPAERAVLFGAGHVAQALAPILKSVDFRVVVMDDRPEFADPSLFPEAAQVICGDFRHLSTFFTLCESDYAVVVTSGHQHDFEVEEQILQQELAYIGVIGSRKKTAAVNAKLRAAGITEAQLAKVHTPIGLSIGAVTPAEIAVSIAAEMIQVRAERRKAEE